MSRTAKLFSHGKAQRRALFLRLLRFFAATFPLASMRNRRDYVSNVMSDSAPFPNDANGDVFRRMQRNGDDLTQARIVEFFFIFPERRQALAFADLVDGRDLNVCVSSYGQKEMWQVQVNRRMVPTHGEVTLFEIQLTGHAEFVGGKADGWGCMTLKAKG